MTNTKFNCAKCGACCKKISDEDSSSKGLPLFEWEVETIKKLAKDKKIKIQIEPIDFILDKKSNLYFCTGFVLTKEPCAFLKNDKCIIHKDRPTICMAFPIAENPFFLKNAPNLSCFSNCCNFDFKNFISKSLELKTGKPYNINKEKIIKEYEKIFDKETMDASFVRDNALNYFDNTISILSKEKLINIEITQNKDAKPIPFLEFLVKRNFITQKQKTNLIKKLIKAKPSRTLHF